MSYDVTVCHLSPKEKTKRAMEKRIRITKLLDDHPDGMTVDEIGEATGLSEEVVKYALNALSSHGDVKKVYKRE